MPTNYYVSPSGSDSNNGLGPDPNHATNKPYASIGKAVGSGGLPTAGDTVYIAPGVYRESVSVSVSGSSGSPIAILGDPGNAQGFKDGSGNLLSPGEVRVTSYTSGDTTAAPGQSVLVLNGRSYLNFANLFMVGGQPGSGGTGSIYIYNGAHDLAFTSCVIAHGMAMSNGYYLVSLQNTTGQTALNVTFDRCVFFAFVLNLLNITLTKMSAGGDYNSGVVVQNCMFHGGLNTINIGSTGTGSNLGGGVSIANCTLTAAYNAAITVADSGISTSLPVTVTNCICGRNLTANTSGQLVEDYNWITGRSNVSPGSNSTADGSQCLLIDVGQSSLWGQPFRLPWTPTVGSPQLGRGTASGTPTFDFQGRNRPEGGGSLSPAIGYLERHDTAVQETAVTDSGSSIRIDGPGSHEFLIPVDATSTTIAVKCRYDTNHGTATPPQAILPGEAEIGVSPQTVTASATTGSWLTLTFTAITPTAKGVVRLILVARPSAANGKCYFDTVSVT